MCYNRNMAQLHPFTPPALSDDAAKPVRQRILFYLPGYDPGANRRYRTLFVRELRRYAKRFGIRPPEISPASLSQNSQVQTWSVKAGDDGLETHTDYDVLLWDDLVRRDMARPTILGAGLNAIALINVAASGTLFRLYRASWKCGNVILYPFVMTFLLPAVALIIVFISHGLLGMGFGLPAEFGVLLGIIGSIAALWKLAPWLERAFLWQLMNDWIFNWQHASGRRPDYSDRLEDFAVHIQSRIASKNFDEVLFVGHSTGALTAAELLARLLDRDQHLGHEGPVLSLLTLGSSMPIVAMQPKARSIRAEIKSLAASRRLVWVDYQAPQDWMNFPGFNPCRDLSLGVPSEHISNPIIRSAKFREIVAPETYRQIRAHPFRMHFQFLMANDNQGTYDIFALTLGPQCLRDRVLAENSSPLSGRHLV